jgi:hypothetical protein
VNIHGALNLNIQNIAFVLQNIRDARADKGAAAAGRF